MLRFKANYGRLAAVLMTGGMLLQLGGCGGYASQFLRQTLVNLPVGLGRALGGSLGGVLDLGSLLTTATGG